MNLRFKGKPTVLMEGDVIILEFGNLISFRRFGEALEWYEGEKYRDNKRLLDFMRTGTESFGRNLVEMIAATHCLELADWSFCKEGGSYWRGELR